MFINNYPPMKRFLTVYRLEESNLHWACNNFTYICSKGKDIIFDETSNDKKFYLLIRGKVFVRYIKKRVLTHHKNKSLLNDNKRKSIDKFHDLYFEKILSPGDYFSTEIKSRGHNIVSALALEDSDLLCLDSKYFEKIFEKNIQKLEKDKKHFIMKTMQPFNDLPTTRFDSFLTLIDTYVIDIYKNEAEYLHNIF